MILYARGASRKQHRRKRWLHFFMTMIAAIFFLVYVLALQGLIAPSSIGPQYLRYALPWLMWGIFAQGWADDLWN